MDQQLQHTDTSFIKNRFPIILICDQVNSPANIGSLFRLADSFGIQKIYFCGKEIPIISKRMQRTARATHQIMPYQQIEHGSAVIKQLQTEGYTVLALEITKDSIPISKYVCSQKEKIALVIGEENLGVSEEILELAEKNVHINMYGTNSSMNVATATGIALYEITQQLITTL